MEKRLYKKLLAGSVGVFFLLQSVAAQSILVSNKAFFARTNEVISIGRHQLGIRDRSLLPVATRNNEFLISQVVDKDGDKEWDELLIQVSLKANEKITVLIGWVKARQDQHYEKRTNVLLSLRSDTNIPSPELDHAIRTRGFTQNIARPFYQLEGPGIENDKVAFRAFFDYRNSKDIYGKIVDTPVLERVGVGAGWHDLQSWGMDIFHTGNSLGAGGLAIGENNMIYRLGDADTSGFRTLYEGALSAGFTLDFTKWDVGSGKKDGSETISLTKGDFFYKDVIGLMLRGDQSLIAGIANFGVGQPRYKKHNEVFSSLSTYGAQAEGTGSMLGVGILFSSGHYISHASTDSASVIPNTSYVALKPDVSGQQIIYFFACWEMTDKRFATEKGFDNYLQESAERLANPITVQVINKQ